jgi:chaperonin GroEL
MSNTQLYGKEARLALLEGATKLNKAVAVTLGPAGRWNLFRHMGIVLSTKDGVTVAKEIQLSDPYESQGADLIKSAAGQTVNEAGDGTTTAVLLTHAIFKAGCDAIDAGAEPVQLVRGIEFAKKVIVGDYDAKTHKFQGGLLEQMSVPCSPELAFQAARISANGDDAVASVVSEAILKIGVDGALTIGESHSPDHVLEIVDGMQINAGYAHPYLINDVQRNRAAYDNVTVALIDRRVSTAAEATGIMSAAIKAAQKESRALAILLIVDDIDPEALQHILQNKLKQQNPIPIVVVRAPLWGDARRDLFEDIGLLSGGKRIESPKGKDYDQLANSDFGFLQRVVVSASKTIITAAPYSAFYQEHKVQPYLDRIKTLIADEGLRPDERDAAKGRLAALTGGVAVIKVGGTSADAVQETKFRVEDAIHATRAAVSEGVVPGGGSALLFSKILATTVPSNAKTKSEEIGEQLIYGILSAPFEQIIKNAGHDEAEALADVLMKQGVTGLLRCGFDASTGLLVDDMIDAGIVDPLRVVRAALNAAAAAAGVLLKTECLIADEPVHPQDSKR